MKRFLIALLSVLLMMSCMTAMVAAEEAEKPGTIADATNIPAFVESYNSNLEASGCDKTFNEDGSLTLTGTWGIDDNSAIASVKIRYRTLWRTTSPGMTSTRTCPIKVVRTRLWLSV